jgi:signal peptide peptidase SppA
MLYERVITACLAVPWAIHPEKLRVIQSILARKARGEAIPEAEIEAARQQQRKPSGPTPPGGVGLVPIYGTITQRADLFTEWSGGTSTEQVGQRIDQLAADPGVKAIVLDVDSPGGSVYGVAELADKIRAVAKDKKVTGVANSEAASAAYWILSQAGEVVVTPNGQVGSIGVYLMHVDQSEELKAIGRSVTLLSAGERKTAGNPYGPLDQLGREELQASVDDYYDKFVRAVARGRGRQPATVRDGFGKGGMVRSEQAVSEGMADRVATLDEVLSRYGVTTADLTAAAASAHHGVVVRRRRMLLD